MCRRSGRGEGGRGRVYVGGERVGEGGSVWDGREWLREGLCGKREGGGGRVCVGGERVGEGVSGGERGGYR